jgi:ABC-type multidrug transport system ATPase subunit
MRGSVAKSMGASSKDLTVTGQSSTPNNMKTILNAVSGSAAPGEVLALMGPSGSGKTSLLNALSGRTTYQSGDLTINGTTLTPQAKKRLLTKIAYVKQADIFFSHLSVRDQLTYTAMLRLPQEWPTEDKLLEVEKILQMLRLTNVAESPIHLVSGGEKKRTNIGTELLTDPSVLLLDEPTSGLDSTSAVSLLQMLQNLAKQHHKTVITSIHQPSSKVFFSFDKLLLLAQGNVVYFGTPRHSLGYLRQVNLACPDGYNVADHWMDLLVTQNNGSGNGTGKSSTGITEISSGDDVEDALKPFSQLLIEAWDNESIAVQVDEDAKKHQEQTAQQTQEVVQENKKFSKYNTSWAMQYRILVHRAMKNSRSAIFTPVNMVKSAALGIMVGMLYFQMPYTESSIFDRNSL